METCYQYACVCSAAVLTSKITTELVLKNVIDFLAAQIAVTNLFQFDLDKP